MTKSNRGGARPGAGRPTKSKRVMRKMDAEAAPSPTDAPFDPTPPPDMPAAAHGTWRRLIEMHGGPGMLRRMDEPLMDLAAKLRALTDSGDAKSGDYSALNSCLDKLRSRVKERSEVVSAPSAPARSGKVNEFDEF